MNAVSMQAHIVAGERKKVGGWANRLQGNATRRCSRGGYRKKVPDVR